LYYCSPLANSEHNCLHFTISWKSGLHHSVVTGEWCGVTITLILPN